MTNIDYSTYRFVNLLSLSELSDKKTTDIGKFCLDIFPKFLYLPYQEIQLPVLISLGLIPSALAGRHLPVGFLCGKQGSGKSTVLELLSYVHGVNVLNSSTTYASLRDSIDLAKFGKKGGGVERNTILLFDNVFSSTFEDQHKYSLFLAGQDRKTSRIRVSAGLAENPIEFDAFGLKVVSSTFPLHLDERFKELSRRLIVFFAERPANGDELLDVSDYDWSVLQETYKEHWLNPSNCERYATVKYHLLEFKRANRSRLSVTEWPLVLELFTTGLYWGIWQTVEDALSCYLQLRETTANYAVVTTLHDFLLKWIEANYKDTNLNPNIIPAKFIAQEIEQAIAQKIVEKSDVSNSEVKRVMEIAGYRLDMKLRGWCKIQSNI
jgi:hypothetical protein